MCRSSIIQNLPKKDIGSLSDPFCVLYIKTGHHDFVETGRTEVIKNNSNPKFVKKFSIQYRFEERQVLKIDVYDSDSKSEDLKKHDFLGNIECPVGHLLAKGGQLVLSLVTSQKTSKSEIIIRATEIANCEDVVTLQFSAVNLDKKDVIGKSDPFLVISKAIDNENFTSVHTTEVIKNELNPIWKPFTLNVQTLCNGDYNRIVKFECYDHDSDGSHDLIGMFTTNLNKLNYGPGLNNVYDCINPKKQAKSKKYKHSGVIRLLQLNLDRQTSFVDYIQKGLQIHLVIAIDFTASNGNPDDPGSLHYRSPTGQNPYTNAIRAVGNILQDYDSALGFGARIPPNGQVCHDFFLNGHPADPYCRGIDGVLEAYWRAVRAVQLFGPTNFAPVLHHVITFAKRYQSGQHYFILLIITDGVINDLSATQAKLAEASMLPISVIIVGVGDEDFSAMKELDADEKILTSEARDIVQFVGKLFICLNCFMLYLAMRDFKNSGSNMSEYLAREVLAELPSQLVDYMRKHGF